jgi:putative hemolysin
MLTWTILLALWFACLFSALHIALVDLARASLEEIAAVRNRPRATRRIERILEDTAGHARAAAVARVAFDAVVVVGMVAQVAALRGHGAATAGDAAIGAAVGAALIWVFGVVVPMAIAWHAGERLVYACSLLLRVAHVAAVPLNAGAAWLNEAVRRLSGAPAGEQAEVLQAELLSVVEEGEREGQIDEAEKEMIEAVVEFRNLTAKQVMTPRTEIEAFEATDDLGAVTRIIRQIGHSRIPVYQESLDNVLGIFYVKDLMRWLAGESMPGQGNEARRPGQPFRLRSILRPALFVPETKPVRELLRELLQKKVHIAMVADEFGGTAGLVTIEDIVEEIIGDIKDEYEQPDEGRAMVEVKPDDHAAVVDARAYIDDVNDALAPLGWSLPDSDDYDTVGGFVITTLGRIPAQGESFRHDRAVVTVLEATATRVLKVRLEVRPAEEAGRPAGVVEAPAGRLGNEGDEPQ